MVIIISSVVVTIGIYLFARHTKTSNTNLASSIAKACVLVDVLLLFFFIFFALTAAQPNETLGKLFAIIFFICLLGMVIFGVLGLLDAKKSTNPKEKVSARSVIIMIVVLAFVLYGLIVLTYFGTHSG